MAIDPLTGGLLAAGGGLLQGIGSIFGAGSARRAAANAQRQAWNNAYQSQLRTGAGLFGFSNANDLVIGGQALTGDPNHDGPILEARARYEQANPGASQVAEQATQTLNTDLGRQEGRQHRTTGRLDTMASQLEGAGRDVQDQNARIIRRNAQTTLNNLNDRTTASLGLFGPSTILSQAQQGNARMVNQDMNDQLVGNNQQALNNFSAARGQRLNLLNQRSILGDTTAGENARTRYSATQAPSLLRLNTIQSPTMNYLNGLNPAGMQSTASAPANFFGGIGSGLSLIGGMGLANIFGGGGGNGGSNQPYAIPYAQRRGEN
jgi:hypothetical protein